MARPLRLEIAGGFYHVTARGDGREAIYLDDTDRVVFQAVMMDVIQLFNWSLHAYCLMGNHYHLLAQRNGVRSCILPTYPVYSSRK
jgi:putative transposase